MASIDSTLSLPLLADKQMGLQLHPKGKQKIKPYMNVSTNEKKKSQLFSSTRILYLFISLFSFDSWKRQGL